MLEYYNTSMAQKIWYRIGSINRIQVRTSRNRQLTRIRRITIAFRIRIVHIIVVSLTVIKKNIEDCIEDSKSIYKPNIKLYLIKAIILSISVTLGASRENIFARDVFL